MTSSHTDPVPGLRRLWDAVPGGQPPVAEMVADGRRRRRRGRAVVAGLVAAAVVATGGGVWATSTGGSEPGRDDAGQVATDPTATTEVTVYYTNEPNADNGYVTPPWCPGCSRSPTPATRRTTPCTPCSRPRRRRRGC